MKYDELTTRLGNYLLGTRRTNSPAIIDPYEHGKLMGTIPKPINLKTTLADKKTFHPKKMSRTHLYQHLTKVPKTETNKTGYLETYYYRSNRAAPGFALLKFDIDAKKDETDAHEQAQTIERYYLPGAYFEPSTGGRGSHLYALVQFDRYTPRRLINQWLKCAGIGLRELMKERGFQSTIDVRTCKTFSEVSTDEHGVRHLSMGQLCKIPRPQNLDDMTRLENAPVFKPYHFDRMIDDFKVLRASKEPIRPVPVAVERIAPPVDEKAMEAVRINCGAFKGMDATDARSRSVHAVMSLSRQLGRLPNVQEARLFYEASGLATVRPSGDTQEDVKRRERRLSGAIEYAGKTFDVSKCGKGMHLETFLPLIREHVKPETVTASGKALDRPITDEDLAVCLWVIEQASFERKERRDEQWTVGNERIIAAFRKLSSRSRSNTANHQKASYNNTCVPLNSQKVDSEVSNAVSSPFGCNQNKAVAMKMILVKSGLAEIIDQSYRPGKYQRKLNDAAWDAIKVTGRCKRICIGHKHPRFAEFNRIYDELVEWVLTGRTTTATHQLEVAI
jgi:hypothetical protein